MEITKTTLIPECYERLHLMTAGKGSGEVKVKIPRLELDLDLDPV